jgi:HlyD family secretion protein
MRSPSTSADPGRLEPVLFPDSARPGGPGSDPGTTAPVGPDPEVLAGRSARRRRRVLALLVAGTVLISGGGLASSSLIKSPAERAAETGPPPRSVLTAAVERRTVQDTLALQGEVISSRQTTVSPQSAAEGSTPVITRVRVKAGAAVDAGRVLVEVSARPVIAMPGSIPVYRDLKPADRGDDVAQLQDALTGLGYPTRDSTGYFGSRTKTAVKALYTHLGYDVIVAGGSDNQTLSAAEDTYRQAQRGYDELRAGGTTASTGGRSAGSAAGSSTAGSEGTGQTSPGSAGTTRGSAGSSTGGSGTSGPSPGLALRYARQDRDRALVALNRARAQAGPMVPAAEVVFLPALPARVVSLNAPLGLAVPTDMLVLSSGALRVKARLPPYQRGRVKVGQRVQIFSDDAGNKYPGVVSAVGSTPVSDPVGGQGAGGSSSGGAGGSAGGAAGEPGPAGGDQGTGGEQAEAYYPITIRPTKPIMPSLQGLQVRVTVEKAASVGRVLAVPASAVSARTDGSEVITVQGPGGALRTVVVRAGVSGDGYVELSGGGVRSGDRVVVGR